MMGSNFKRGRAAGRFPRLMALLLAGVLCAGVLWPAGALGAGADAGTGAGATDAAFATTSNDAGTQQESASQSADATTQDTQDTAADAATSQDTQDATADAATSQDTTSDPDASTNTPQNMAADVPDNLLNESQLPDSSFLYDASIADLQDADSYMNGQTVQVTGEVVGDCILADFDSNYCWITLQATDGTFAEVEVCMTRSQAGVIDSYGRYGVKGTTLQVRGVFNLACSDHEGLTDLHANNVALLSRGSSTADQVDYGMVKIGVAFALLAGALTLLFRYLKERNR